MPHDDLTSEADVKGIGFVTLELIRTLYDYDRWATERIFDTAESLTPEQLNAPGTAGHGSIHETLLHLVSAQRDWASWWNGTMTAEESMTNETDPADYPDLHAVRAFWNDGQQQLWAFIDGLTEKDLEQEFPATLPWTGQTVTFTLWQMMAHVANHGTQHRSEAAAMLTTFDHSPGFLDLIHLLLQRTAVPQD